MKQDIFEIEEILLEGGAAITSGDGDPAVLALDYPSGTVYLRTNGQVWQKQVGAPSNWLQLTANGKVGNPKRVKVGETVVVEDGRQLLVRAQTFLIEGTLILEGDADLSVIQ